MHGVIPYGFELELSMLNNVEFNGIMQQMYRGDNNAAIYKIYKKMVGWCRTDSVCRVLLLCHVVYDDVCT